MKSSEFMVGGEDFNSIKAGQAMENRFRCCYPSTSWKDIVSFLVDGEFGSLPVIDSERNLIAIVSEYDLLKVLYTGKNENEITAQDIMSRDTITVTEETPMMDVIKLLQDSHLIRVPVVNGKKLVGILARRDLLLCHLRANGQGT